MTAIEAIHAKSEVVHEGIHIVAWPQTVYAVEECVESGNGEADVAPGHAVNQLVECSVDKRVEISLWHRWSELTARLAAQLVERHVGHALVFKFRNAVLGCAVLEPRLEQAICKGLSSEEVTLNCV